MSAWRVWLSPEGELATDNPAGLAELQARPEASTSDAEDCDDYLPLFCGMSNMPTTRTPRLSGRSDFWGSR